MNAFIPATAGIRAAVRSLRPDQRAGMAHTSLRAMTVAAGIAVALTVPAAGAAAHVTIQPSTATQGAYETFAFRVPTERDNASTTTVEVTFPTDPAIPSARVKPHPGWSYTMTTLQLPEPIQTGEREITEAVEKITWTAQGDASAIKPGEYDEFWISLGPLPEAEQLVFKAVQTYSNGEKVGWIEEAVEGAEEPERPAPVLHLTEADEAHEDGADGADGAASGAGTGVPATHDDDENDDDAATWLAGAALLVALGAAALAALGLRRRSPRSV